MSVREKSHTEQFIRGGDIFSHRLTLFFVNLWRVIWKSTLGGLLVFFLSCWLMLDKLKLAVLTYYWPAKFATAVGLGSNRLLVRDVNLGDGYTYGRLTEAQIVQLLQAPYSDHVATVFWLAFLIACSSIGFFALAITRFYTHFGRVVGEDDIRRGSRRSDTKTLIEAVKKSDRGAGKYSFVGVPLPAGKEMYNIMATGAQGSGKSVAMLDLAKQVADAGRKMIIYDKTGEFIEHFYRPGIDIILDPMDDRFPGWNIFSEVQKVYDFERIGHALVSEPGNENATSQYFATAVRTVFYCVMQRLHQEGRRTTQALAEVLLTFTVQELHDYLEGTPAAAFIDPSAAQQAAGVASSIVESLQVFQHLKDGGFSITEWISRDDDSRLFIASNEDVHQIIRPLLSMFLSIAVRATLALPRTREDRVWLFLDELASLNRLSIMKEVLTEGRKFGIVSVLGFQSVSQLEECYGRDVAKILSSNLQTFLILSVSDEDTAKAYSERLGDQELDEQSEGVSLGIAANRDGSSVNTSRRDKQIVTRGEILSLDECTGFLKVSGPFPVAFIDFKPIREKLKTWKPTQAAYLPRPDLCLTHRPSAPPAAPVAPPVSASPTPALVLPMPGVVVGGEVPPAPLTSPVGKGWSPF